ncbi:FAD-binding oxidoreductase (plasmid) [Streptomyces sp. DSM 116496]|uniref:FAD-binding oxidoreductase n=1 Tax=Streptomyces stoeckheimensis TaxID=3344656 RepID=UPI0038B24ECB
MISRRTMLGTAAAGVGVALLPQAAGATAAATSSTPWWSWLDLQLDGRLVLPSHAEYPVAKQLELAQFDVINPQAIAYCKTPADVSNAILFARDEGLQFAVRSGGHNYAGASTTTGLVIDVSEMNSIKFGTNNSVTIGPGALNIDVLNTLATKGLSLSSGGCPTVAAGGFLQGGGLSFMTRSLGVGCDSVKSAQVVLANGSIVTASATKNSDLYWAIRGGGGGNFGVVTSYELTAHVIGPLLVSYLFFPYERSAEILDASTRWLVNAPRSISGGAYITLPDAAPGAVPTTVVTLVSRGTSAELAAETARLLAMTGQPVGRNDMTTSYQNLMLNIFGCGSLSQDACRRSEKTTTGQLTRPAFGVERMRMVSQPLPLSGWTDVMTAFDAHRAAGQRRTLEIHWFGGAANDVAASATAYPHRDTLFCVSYRSTTADAANATPAGKAVAQQWVDGGFAAVNPHSNGGTYVNYMDPALQDWKQSYYGANYSRLVTVKKKYDPARIFNSTPQSVGAA